MRMMPRWVAPCLLVVALVRCGPPKPVPHPLTDPTVCDDAVADIYAFPRLDAPKGTILRCAHERDVSSAELLALAQANGYLGPALPSGARVFRVVYRTERGDPAASPGFSTALVFLPDTPAATPVPLVAAAHGTVGEGRSCLASQDLTLADADPVAQFYPLAGAGFAVIAPDYAGYSQFGAAGNPPSGYGTALDAPKSLLDSVKALRSMLPTTASDTVFFTGHSQGGQVALAALSLVDSYGVDARLGGVVAYAPGWTSGLTMAAMVGLGNAPPFTLTDTPINGESALWAFYSNGELFDGPGHGLDAFAPRKQAAIKSFFEDTCLQTVGQAPLASLGTYIDDLFDPAFVRGVGVNMALGIACPGDGSREDGFCQTWGPRLKAVRPHLPATMKSVPILYVWGDADVLVAPTLATCGVDRLLADGANLQTCVYPGVTHSGILRSASSRVNQWIAARAYGAPAPGACPADFVFATADGGAVTSSVPADGGGFTSCLPVPRNDGD